MSKKELQNKKVIFSEIKTLIEASKQQVAVAVNSAMSMLYWDKNKQ